MLKLKANGITHELPEIGEALIPNLYSGTKDFDGTKWESAINQWDLTTKVDGFTVAKKATPWGAVGQALDVRAGEVYRMTAMVRMGAGGSFYIEAGTSADDPKSCKADFSRIFNESNYGWQKCAVTFTITKSGKAVFRIGNSADSGAFEIYAIHLCRVKSAGETSYWCE